MKLCKLLRFFNLSRRKSLPVDWFLYDRALCHERVNHSYNKFTESEVKKENTFSRSRNFNFTCIHFNIYECLKWFEKPLWLINTKFCDITDMFKNTEAGVPRWSVKMVFLTVSQNSQESIYVGVSY